MNRATLILLIDIVAFVGFVFLTTTGILLHYLLPPGSGRWSEVWSLSRHDWGAIHFWISVAFFAVLSAHLILHWRVALGLLRGHRPEQMNWRIALGLVALVAIVLLAVAPLFGASKTGGGGIGLNQRVSDEQAPVPRGPGQGSGYRGGQE